MKSVSPMRSLRRARTISQEEFARLLGVGQETISKYERGVVMPPVGTRHRIAAILGTTVRELWPDTEAVTK